MPDLAALLRRAGPEGWLARAIAPRASPTADLYFRNSCSDLLARGLVRALAPTVFVSPAAELVIRHDARAPAQAGRARIYLMDDVWTPAARGPELSAAYRLRLALLETRAARWHLARAADVVVSSEPLAEAARCEAPGARVHLLDPFWTEPLGDLRHFAGPGLDLAFLGGASHAADLAFLAPVLRSFLDETPHATLTLSGEVEPPPALRGHPRLSRIGVTDWAGYRAALPGLRFHLALYPLRQTAFNAARSVNKLIEHAVTGAPTLTSRHWGPGRLAEAAGAALALPERAEDWAAALRVLAGDRARLAGMSAAALSHAAALNRPERQRALWLRLLGLAAT